MPRTTPLSTRALARRSVLLGAGAGLSLTACGSEDSDESAPGRAGEESRSPRPSPTREPEVEGVTITHVGDAFPGKWPDRLPAEGDDAFFAKVSDRFDGDVNIANLEGAFSTAEWQKCESGCIYFRLPGEYASLYSEAGFDVLNHANNHAWDAGPQGAEETRDVVEGLGMELSGHQGTITQVERNGISVAIVGFAPYYMFTDSRDIQACDQLVREAAASADVVVVSVHMGAEGTDARHVTAGTETFHGEDRGDPMGLSHACVDAGADVVIGHGPHVMRGMEYYNGKLIAYSLGNFGGGQNILDGDGWLGVGGVLSVTLSKDGETVESKFTPTVMDSNGYPAPDDQARGLDAINELAEDFGSSGVVADESGQLLFPDS
ncbi:CapA family protein [Haloglycomyces albus]|uniref:CapA family protein n=1 Tax=Haloglycomyces albus TaxID=526067 RepID=UPI00046D5334|nr:CapA family protein [Haloglycomyces albus]